MIRRPASLVLPCCLAWAVVGPGCATPVARAQLAEVDDRTLLQQMLYLDRPAGDFEFGPGGREGYAEAVREEILRRRPDWPPEVVAAVREHRAEIGMTPSQVVAAIGWPREYPSMLWAWAPGTSGPFADDLQVSIERSRANRWHYGDAPHNLHVWFSNGRVWNIIDNR